MIRPEWIDEWARKNRTTRDNAAREYCQHLFLSRFYQCKGAEKVLFKGGTSLRILWQSPRFSEDLDFTGMSVTQAEIEDAIEAVIVEISREGLTVDIEESKKTSGGYLGKLRFQLPTGPVPIKLEVSGRKKRPGPGTPSLLFEQTLVQNEFIPAYSILHLPQKEIVGEKISAVASRGKPRDYFDLYFIIRSRLPFAAVFGRDKGLKQRILKQLRSGEIDFSRELARFLPVSHHPLLKNFEQTLTREIERALP